MRRQVEGESPCSRRGDCPGARRSAKRRHSCRLRRKRLRRGRMRAISQPRNACGTSPSRRPPSLSIPFPGSPRRQRDRSRIGVFVPGAIFPAASDRSGRSSILQSCGRSSGRQAASLNPGFSAPGVSPRKNSQPASNGCSRTPGATEGKPGALASTAGRFSLGARRFRVCAAWANFDAAAEPGQTQQCPPASRVGNLIAVQ